MPAGSPNKADAFGRAYVDRRQRVADMVDIIQVVVLVAGFALAATLVFFLKGLYLIRAGEVGVLVKRLGGRKMPAGQVIARHGEIGTQAATLMPGLYWRMPVVWSMRRSRRSTVDRCQRDDSSETRSSATSSRTARRSSTTAGSKARRWRSSDRGRIGSTRFCSTWPSSPRRRSLPARWAS